MKTQGVHKDTVGLHILKEASFNSNPNPFVLKNVNWGVTIPISTLQLSKVEFQQNVIFQFIFIPSIIIKIPQNYTKYSHKYI